MTQTLRLKALDTSPPPSVTDLVYEELYKRVVELDLPPGARLSEADVARQMDISRQPVRDAFYRLSQLGFLQIRPQRATTVAPISTRAVLEARFIRTAIELETISLAAERVTPETIASLHELIDRQRKAIEQGDRILFHNLDDEFHRTLCAIADAEFAWTLIRDKKAHMDRVRYLSLAVGAQSALDDHLKIMNALERNDVKAARKAMRMHLSRIVDIIAQIRSERGAMFVDESA